MTFERKGNKSKNKLKQIKNENRKLYIYELCSFGIILVINMNKVSI